MQCSVQTFRDELSVTSSWVKQVKKNVFLVCLTLESGAYRLSQNVRNYQLTLRNVPEQGQTLFAPPRKP